VAAHDDDAADEDGAAGPEDPVGHPPARQRRQVDQPRVQGGDRHGDGLIEPEAVLGHVRDEERQQDALEAIEAEPFPHLGAEEDGEAAGVPEEGLLAADGGVFAVGHRRLPVCVRAGAARAGTCRR
jgi:hypothetical protein